MLSFTVCALHPQGTCVNTQLNSYSVQIILWSHDGSFHIVKSSQLYLYNAFNNTNCNKATAQYQNRHIFELKAFHYWMQWCHHPAQFTLNSICAIKSVILLEMKCPQLSKPEEPKLHPWQNGEKSLGETRLSRGGSSPLARRTSSFSHLCIRQSAASFMNDTHTIMCLCLRGVGVLVLEWSLKSFILRFDRS